MVVIVDDCLRQCPGGAGRGGGGGGGGRGGVARAERRHFHRGRILVTVCARTMDVLAARLLLPE